MQCAPPPSDRGSGARRNGRRRGLERGIKQNFPLGRKPANSSRNKIQLDPPNGDARRWPVPAMRKALPGLSACSAPYFLNRQTPRQAVAALSYRPNGHQLRRADASASFSATACHLSRSPSA